MNLNIFFAIMGTTNIVLVIAIIILISQHQQEKHDLLNRVMARDFVEYKNYTEPVPKAKSSKGSAHRTAAQKADELINYD